MRPGVPTITWAPRRKAVCSGRMDRPPYNVWTRRPAAPANVSATSATCMASSRVGTSTSAWTCRDAESHCSASGMANASVLPDPVRACPIRSRPAMRRGMHLAWMGVGSLMPMPAIAAWMGSPSAMSWNDPTASMASWGAGLVSDGSIGRTVALGAGCRRRFWKHGRQYTGRPDIGRKGTVVNVSHAAHTASWRPPRRAGRVAARGRSGIVLPAKDWRDIREWTPCPRGKGHTGDLARSGRAGKAGWPSAVKLGATIKRVRAL